MRPYEPHEGGPDAEIVYAGLYYAHWILVEVKGLDRTVAESARAATQDLLAYRRAFRAALDRQPKPYGLGIAWGESLEPSSSSEIVLCSPDRIDAALGQMLTGGYLECGSVALGRPASFPVARSRKAGVMG